MGKISSRGAPGPVCRLAPHIASEEDRQLLRLETVALVAHARRLLHTPSSERSPAATAALAEDASAAPAVVPAQQHAKCIAAETAAEGVAIRHPVRRLCAVEAAQHDCAKSVAYGDVPRGPPTQTPVRDGPMTRPMSEFVCT